MTTDLPVSEIVVRRLKELRREREWSARRLAEECRKLGADMPDSTIENLERAPGKSRKRRDVSLDHLLVFAAALDVPPLALLVPDNERIAITPELSIDAMQLAVWFFGTVAAPTGKAIDPFDEQPSDLFAQWYQRLEALAALYELIEMVKNIGGPEADERLFANLAGRIEPYLRAGWVPATLPREWLPVMVELNYLPASVIPPEEVDDAGR